MSKKKELTLSILGVLTLIVIVIGSSYAYYVARTNSGGTGSNVDVRTATLGDTTVTTEGSIGFSDTNIYPGHRNISKIKVTATGDKNVLYNLTWTGTNTLNTPLKYYVYKTTTEETPTITCTKKEVGTIETHLYEECVNNNFNNLGEIVKEGTIETASTSSITKLIKNEEIQATSSGATIYYYIVLEYENTESEQNIDMNGTFNGVVNTTLLEKREPCDVAYETILANKMVEERTDFSTTFEDNTTGKIFTSQDNDGTSYYFAGSVDNNWVKFGELQDDLYYGYMNATSSSYIAYTTLEECQNATVFHYNCTLVSRAGKDIYWRIVRINGDGTIRLIYNGITTDQVENFTYINEKSYKFSHKDAYWNTSSDNAYTTDNAYVGYMYGTVGSSTYEETHTNINSSYVKQVVDEWYNTHLNKDGIKEHIDTNAGFCGDRSLASGTGIGTTYTEYGFASRIYSPTLKCTNSNDLYTVSSSNKGNKALTYPVGLITADEVAYAGAEFGNNASNYLYSNQYFWTMTPYVNVIDAQGVFMFAVDSGILYFSSLDYETFLRPVINLKADTHFTGDGTTSNPYQVS